MQTDNPLETMNRLNNEKENPPPGSDAAIAIGCICPVLDNARGRGYMGVTGAFVIRAGCPVHNAGVCECGGPPSGHIDAMTGKPLCEVCADNGEPLEGPAE